jgi:hypothetical protein
VKKLYWGRNVSKTADVVTHVSAGATVAGSAAFFSMEWWNHNSAGIIAICAVFGALISLISFIVARYKDAKAKKNVVIDP